MRRPSRRQLQTARRLADQRRRERVVQLGRAVSWTSWPPNARSRSKAEPVPGLLAADRLRRRRELDRDPVEQATRRRGTARTSRAPARHRRPIERRIPIREADPVKLEPAVVVPGAGGDGGAHPVIVLERKPDRPGRTRPGSAQARPETFRAGAPRCSSPASASFAASRFSHCALNDSSGSGSSSDRSVPDRAACSLRAMFCSLRSASNAAMPAATSAASSSSAPAEPTTRSGDRRRPAPAGRARRAPVEHQRRRQPVCRRDQEQLRGGPARSSSASSLPRAAPGAPSTPRRRRPD